MYFTTLNIMNIPAQRCDRLTYLPNNLYKLNITPSVKNLSTYNVIAINSCYLVKLFVTELFCVFVSKQCIIHTIKKIHVNVYSY